MGFGVLHEVTEEAHRVSYFVFSAFVIVIQLQSEESLGVITNNFKCSVTKDVAKLSGDLHNLRREFTNFSQAFLDAFKVLFVHIKHLLALRDSLFGSSAELSD